MPTKLKCEKQKFADLHTDHNFWINKNNLEISRVFFSLLHVGWKLISLNLH